jgi:hypothetical protein
MGEILLQNLISIIHKGNPIDSLHSFLNSQALWKKRLLDSWFYVNTWWLRKRAAIFLRAGFWNFWIFFLILQCPTYVAITFCSIPSHIVGFWSVTEICRPSFCHSSNFESWARYVICIMEYWMYSNLELEKKTLIKMTIEKLVSIMRNEQTDVCISKRLIRMSEFWWLISYSHI